MPTLPWKQIWRTPLEQLWRLSLSSSRMLWVRHLQARLAPGTHSTVGTVVVVSYLISEDFVVPGLS